MTFSKEKIEYLPENTVCNTPPANAMRRIKFAIGVIVLLCACFIYLCWRSDRINLYVWSGNIGLSSVIDFLRTNIGSFNPGTFVKNSLPDGLYCVAYILIMDCIWENTRRRTRIFMTLLIPAVAIVHEILQYFNVVSGTFDSFDLLCYSLPVLVYLLLLRNHH